MSLESDDLIQQLGNYSFNNQEIRYNQTQTGALIVPNQRDSSSSSSSMDKLAPTRKRQRCTRVVKKKEQVELQRMTHIAVERNRRTQMNHYLSLLKSIMPPSYVHKGDQASIVGGAINFVKEQEQLLHSLEAHKRFKKSDSLNLPKSELIINKSNVNQAIIEEVRKVESHVSLKIVLRKQPKLLLKMLKGFYSLSLTVVHINVTTFHHMMLLFSLSLKIEDDCKMSSVDEISAAVYQMVGQFQEETVSNFPL